MGCEIQEKEAERDHDFAVVQDRPKRVRRVEKEIGDRHLAAADETDDTSPQADRDEDTANYLDNARGQT